MSEPDTVESLRTERDIAVGMVEMWKDQYGRLLQERDSLSTKLEVARKVGINVSMRLAQRMLKEMTMSDKLRNQLIAEVERLRQDISILEVQTQARCRGRSVRFQLSRNT